MASSIIAGNSGTYKAHQHDTLLSEVGTVICVLLPRSFTVAGFSRQGNVLAIRSSGYPGDRPAWDLSFFEEQVMNDPLLALQREQVTVFAGTELQLLVPNELYDAALAEAWLKKLHLVTPGDVFITSNVSRDHAQYLFAIPGAIHSMIAERFGNAKLLPLTAYQLNKLDQKPGAFLQCLLSAEEVFATMRMNGRIIWHQVFPYTHASDIAWQFAGLCKQLHIPLADLRILASILNEHNFDELLELETYFPKLRWSSRSRPEEYNWEPAIYLMEQLYECVS